MLGARLSVLTASLCCLLWASGQGQETPQETQLFCDDKMVEDAVDAALVKLNGMLKLGMKNALYQILEAKKVVNESGTDLSVSFTSRLSDCPIGGDKPWRDCEYFLHGSENPKTCKADVFVTEGSSDVHLIDCAFEPVVAEKVPCLGCPEEIDVDSKDLKEPLGFSVGQANKAHNEAYLFMLKDVVSASRQVVAGFRYQLRFNMQSSNCSKEQFPDVTEDCHPHENPTFVKCNSTVDVAPWRHEQPDGSVNCELGQYPTLFSITRRRPPGWTPLRTFDIPEITVAPKKESSEEEQDMSSTASTATNPETATTTPTPQSSSNQTPFNCPSKPWKEFVPLPAVPPSTNTSKPESDGLFSDADLLL